MENTLPLPLFAYVGLFLEIVDIVLGIVLVKFDVFVVVVLFSTTIPFGFIGLFV